MRGEFLDLGGARLYYYAAGTRGAGVPVVFVHGFPTSSHLWSDVVPLMPPGHRLVVFDLLGFGRSDRPLNHPVDMAAHAERTCAVLEELRIDRACIVGHGVGGGVAQLLAMRHPHRVSHLCLIDSVAIDRPPTLGGRLAAAAFPLARFLPPSLLIAVLRRDLAHGYSDRGRAERSIDLYLRPFADAAGRDALVAHIHALSRGTPAANEGTALSMPTALIWGQHDRLVHPPIARRLQATISGATLELVPGARHFLPEEAPRRITETIGALLERS